MEMAAIIQARMGSTRLPGKVLLDIGGETMLSRVVQRCRQATSLDAVIVATASGPADEPIVFECARLGVEAFRGSEADVLDRFYRAAQRWGAQGVVRITADCPLIDPGVIDRVVRAFGRAQPDYASNVLKRSYPRGLDTEVMTLSALQRAWSEASEPYQRAHVTPYFYQRPGLLRLLSVVGEPDRSQYRWTVDTTDDLTFVRAVYRRLGNEGKFDWLQVVALLEREPELVEMNRQVQQKSLQEG
jgi:spore coat polysaccharide biosynthesis protein SpsF